jgi:flagellar protein FliL
MADDKDTPEEKDQEPVKEGETPDDASQEDVAADALKKKPLKLIMLVSAGVILIGSLAVTTSIIFLSDDSDAPTQAASDDTEPDEAPQDDIANNEAGTEAEEEEEGEPKEVGSPQFFPIRPAFVVNIPSKGRIRFLQIQVDIMSRDDDVIDDIETYAPLIKNELVSLFSNQTYEGVVSPEGKERLRKEALKRVQKVMSEQAGVDGIEQILFTSFVTQ